MSRLNPTRLLVAGLVAAGLMGGELVLGPAPAGASPPGGTIAAVSQPTVSAASTGQPAGNWTITVTGGTFVAGDTITVTVMDKDDPGTDTNCNSHTDSIGLSGVPTVTVGTPSPSGGTAATVNVTIGSSGPPCAVQPVNDQMVIHFTNGSAAGQTLTVSNVKYDIGNTVAAGAVVVLATGETGGAAPGSGTPLTNSGTATASDAVVSTVSVGTGGGSSGLSPNTPNQAIGNVVLTEQTAGAVPTGYVCLSINMPSGSGAPNFTPSSRPLVTTGGNSATVSDGSGGSPGTTSGTTLGAGTTPTTLFFKVNTASTSATTYTVSGLKVDTGSALGALVIGIGTDPASPAAACANAASASPNLGTASPSGALDPLTRLWGNDRIATANAVSANSFPTAGSASAVVLTRSDVFADALAGGPLAVLTGGPLLLTGSTALDPTTETELKRVLAAGGTVYLLGGDAALAPVIAARLTALGFNPVRYGGGNRFETATIIASQGLSNPATVLLASGLDFPDALAGGAAAAKAGAAILLTEGSGPAPETTTYLAGHTGDTKYALGGPAAAAYPSASPLVGVDRYETSVKIANQFFASPAVVGIASGSAFPDALTGAPHIGRQGGPLLLVQLDVVPASVRSYLSNNAVNIGAAFSYGGPAVTSDATLADVQNAISGH